MQLGNRVLVLAPHPDDEVLGVGGTIARFAAEGAEIYIAILTKGYPPAFDNKSVRRARSEAVAAGIALGARKTIFLSLPAAALDTVAHRKINARLVELYQATHPDVLFIPFNGDIHLDHQRIFHSALVACRPNSVGRPKSIYAYETLSESNWNAPYLTPGFSPNVFVDISEHLEKKLKAMRLYRSQLKSFPHERSLETIRALALLRGSTAGCSAAESFVLVRQVI